MKKSKVTRSLLAACSIVALTAVLHGCLHSGDGPTYSELDLMGYDTADGATVMAGTYGVDDVPASLLSALAGYSGTTMGDTGDVVTAGGVTFTCVAGPCSVQVAPDESHFTTTGTISVSSYMEPAPDPAIAQLNAVTMAAAAVGTAVAAIDDTDQASITAAQNAVNALNTAIGAAANVDAATLDGYRAQASLAQASVTTAQNTYNAAKAAKEEEERKAAAAVVTKAAGTKLTAMNAEKDQTADASLGGTARTDAEYAGGSDANTDGDTSNDVYRLTISRDRDGTEVKVTDADQNNKADPKFVDQMAGLDDGRFMLVRTMDADDDGNVEEEVVVVGTDIKAPRAVAFAKVSGQALNARDLDANVDADGDGTNDNDYTALFVGADANTPPVAATVALVKSPAFPLTGDGVLSFDSNTDGTVTDEADEVSGMYNGAAGTYRCNAASGTNCTVTIGDDPDDDGTKRIITAMSAGWVFTPNAGVTSDVPDTSYLHYGFWLKKTTDGDGVLTYDEVETFAGASIAASGDVSAVQGTASYDGDAVGVYVHHVLSEGGGKIESSTAGHFKADASLTATFAQIATGANADSIPPNMLNSVTGTIDNFTLSGGETQDWSVNLARGAIDNTTSGSEGTFSGMAEGGGASGSYSGTFHGDVTAATDGTVPQPSAVVGEFNANMSNGSVAGAFGADKE